MYRLRRQKTKFRMRSCDQRSLISILDFLYYAKKLESVIPDSSPTPKFIRCQSLRFPTSAFFEFLGEPPDPSVLPPHTYSLPSLLWPGSPNGAAGYPTFRSTPLQF
ncbi:hypothetical protein AVEN_219357-1 [Araneus ventricosus]|uniref:Uncharacterized protein n=1 Tax=Araneus ventricosus TaxID=182803 RepID=A0A4Y2BEI9_ARAVE|nr:hypothetical protein AVEN_219357-1 [Araneus ventricosus]